MADEKERVEQAKKTARGKKIEDAAESAAKSRTAKKTSAKGGKTGAVKEAAAGGKEPSPDKEAGEGKKTPRATAAAEEKPPTGSGKEEPAGEREISEEEFRHLVEESLEKVTVADLVLTMMNQLASIGYLKMGLPENVNLKYRDLDQALLAIDTLEAMIRGMEGKISEDSLRPYRGTLANLQLNFVQLRRGRG